jgi:cell division protein FtsZ
MEMVLPNDGKRFTPKIKIIGVGGAGGNAVNSMIASNIRGVDFMVANTDAQDLQKSKAKTRIQLGAELTKGQGAGGDPEKGKYAAEETIKEIEEALVDTNMLFISAGMGGGTGTGAAPVIARIAREKDILTLGIVSLPFEWEGVQRKESARKGIQEFQDIVDTLIVIPNDKIAELYKDLTFLDAFKKTDDVITNAAQAVAEIIDITGYINLDFADIARAMVGAGYALIGMGVAEGENRAEKAAGLAISNPLLADIELSGCKALIVSITAGQDIMTPEFNTINSIITSATGQNANIKSGLSIDDKMTGKIKVTIIATGLSPSDAVKALNIDLASMKKDNNTATSPQPATTTQTTGHETAKPLFSSTVAKPMESITPDHNETIARIIKVNNSEPSKIQRSYIIASSDFKQTEPPAFLKRQFN